MPLLISEAWHQIQEDLALESEEDNYTSDETSDDTEDERIHYDRRLDPAEDDCDV